MSGLEIVAVHPDDADRPDRPGSPGVFPAWHAAVVAAHRAETGEAATVWTAPEIAVSLAVPTLARRSEAWAGLVDGEVVTTGMLVLSLLDDLRAADVEVTTPPEHRRQGHGSAMLAHLEQRCREEGRSRLDAESAWPHAGGPDPSGTPGHDFAVHRRLPVRPRRRPARAAWSGARRQAQRAGRPRGRAATRRTRCGRGAARCLRTSSRAGSLWTPR